MNTDHVLSQEYSRRRNRIVRTVAAGAWAGSAALDIAPGQQSEDPSHLWWGSVVRGSKPESNAADELRVIDLFSSVGGLSLGTKYAAEAAGLRHVPIAAVDVDEAALRVYQRNFSASRSVLANVASLVDFHVYGRGAASRLAYRPEVLDPGLAALGGQVDLIVAGPPCQGHSSLNNHTRGSDPRNMLYLCVAAMAVALDVQSVLIENVPDIVRDKGGVVATAQALLEQAGYRVSTHVLSATDFGCAQSRKRHFLVATRGSHAGLATAVERLGRPAMTLRDAIGDLEHIPASGFMFETPSINAANQSRIEYLFANGIYDLPDDVRPDCHKNGHTYPSVYGRLAWDKPAQTLTTGFMTIGRGRYIHPSQKRVLTPREAARIQGFPDDFHFATDEGVPLRRSLAKWIGDAVPAQLAYVAALVAISGIARRNRK